MNRLSLHQRVDRRKRRAGFGYIEVLIATGLIALMLAPALEGLSIGLQGSQLQLVETATHYHVASRMEEVLAKSFDDLLQEAAAAGDASTPTSYSDAVDARLRRLVYLGAYDLDNADGDNDSLTGGEPEVLWIRVEIENSNRFLETLSSQ
jgi:type II secretory pathway pseudopilin PulG